MKVLTVKSQYDTLIREEDVNLLSLLSNPVSLPKDKIPQWIFANKVDGEFKRKNSSIATVHCMQIEYDKGEITVDEWVTRYSNYSFALYTSSGHTPNLHKFRVIIPLKESVEYSNFISRLSKNIMCEIFTGIDDSCFTNWQKIPALTLADPSFYKYVTNNGKKFDYIEEVWNKVEYIIQQEEQIKQMQDILNPKKTYNTINYDAYKLKVDESMEDLISDIPSRENGGRYRAFVSVMGSMLSSKYPDGVEIYSIHDIRHMLRRVYWDSNLENTLKRLERGR